MLQSKPNCSGQNFHENGRSGDYFRLVQDRPLGTFIKTIGYLYMGVKIILIDS